MEQRVKDVMEAAWQGAQALTERLHRVPSSPP